MAADTSEPVTIEGESRVNGERVRPLQQAPRRHPIIGSWSALFWVALFVVVNILIGWAKNIGLVHH